jgi:3-deoxy-7-phosphoheptulonate synthase
MNGAWILLERGADLETLKGRLAELGQWASPIEGGGRRGLVLAPASAGVEPAALRALDGVEAVLMPPSPHPLVDGQRGRDLLDRDGRGPVLMAGPCSAESEGQVFAAAKLAYTAGATWLRGGAYKPRTSPYAFAGEGRCALGWLRRAADEHEMKLVTEVMSEGAVEEVAAFADMLQIGSRNMQNYSLLRVAGSVERPVLLKRGAAATVDEWLLAGEHLLLAGAESVLFCERGLRSWDPHLRNLPDLAAVATLKHVYGQTVVFDPSHATGRRDLIAVMSRAAVAAGADGLLVEVHPDPASARSDGPQALPAEELRGLLDAG